MEPVRWGIVGVARIATEKVIPGMRMSPLCDIRAIASRSIDKARAAAGRLGIPKAYGSYEDLLADPEIEAVYIPLPNDLHVPLTLQAAKAGKHVLCEKPIALDAGQAESLRSIEGKVLFQEAFMVRHHPQWLRARALIRDGAIGAVKAVLGAFTYFPPAAGDIRYDPAMAGGALWDVGCYPITIARLLFDAEPVRAVALSDIGPTGVDLMTSGLVDFGNGRNLSFVSGMAHGPTQFIRVLGTEGSIEAPLPYYGADRNGDPHLIIDSRGTVTSESLPANPYHCQGDAFSRAVRGEIALEYGTDNAIRHMRVLDALARSARSGGWENI